ncbi:hypothetical protein MC885_003848 [Smutsia gigantea]|nr:hypothetical protein MC885_003848 [Smutsia gigantea]
MLLCRLRATEAEQDDKFTNILDVVGELGAFQRRLVALTFIPIVLSAFFMFADVFVFTAQKPYCNTSWILAVGRNLSAAAQLNLTLPRDPNGSFLTCLVYLPVDWDLDHIIQFGLNYTDSCQDGWVYPETKKQSLFDLVCGKELNTEAVQTMLMAGLLIGSLIFRFLSDKLGCYPTILLSLLGLTILGFGTAFASSFHQSLFFHFGVSQAVVGCTISSVSLASAQPLSGWWACTDPCHHSGALLLCCGDQVSDQAGLQPSTLPAAASGGRGPRVPSPLLRLGWAIGILPESPRWLMMKGEVEEAKQVLCYAAGVSKKTLPLSLLDKRHLPGKKVTKASVLDFYNNQHLCKVTLVMGCVRFTVGYSYFTLSLKLKDLGMNSHFTRVVPGIMEVPTRLCCIFVFEQLGRRWSLVVTLARGSFMRLLTLTHLQSTLSLSLCSLLPETQGQPLTDIVDHFPQQRR